MHIYKLRINNKLKKDVTRVWLQKVTLKETLSLLVASIG